MKIKLTALALSAAALSLAPKPALAGDREWAAVGGFVGGLIIGSALNEHRHDAYPARHTTVVVARPAPPAVCYAPVIDRCDDRPAGYWLRVEERVWVPGYWAVSYDCGRRVRYFVPGHYECRVNRVWVSYDRRDHDGYCERDVSYGYGRHRR
jgi:hypothetical protein